MSDLILSLSHYHRHIAIYVVQIIDTMLGHMCLLWHLRFTLLYVVVSISTYNGEVEWVQYKCTRVRVWLLWTCTSTSTQKTNVYEYDYFTIYSSTSTITLECNHDYFHDYFHEYSVSNIKATFMESLGVILVLLLCH